MPDITNRLINEFISHQVDAGIEAVMSMSREYPHRFLSEHDVQAWLFQDLIQRLKIEEENSAFCVNCETSYLTEENRLNWRPDITVFERENLMFGYGELARKKGHTYCGGAVAIEIKLEKKIQKRIPLSKIRNDFEKLSAIRDRHYSDPHEDFGYFPKFLFITHRALADGLEETIQSIASDFSVKAFICSTYQEN